MAEPGTNGKAAVYVSWITFKNALDQLAQGVPNQIDRTAFPGLSGGVQNQLLAGMKFLGLIDDDGKPTPALHAIAVPDEKARKDVLKQVLHDRYLDLFALDLTKTTPAQLGEQMEKSYNVTGDTREKAVRFFLGAVDYLGIPVSRFLSRETGTTPRRRRASTPRSRETLDEESSTTTPPSRSAGPARTVTLKSGGTLTVSASLDIFSLNEEDRAFVFELIDRLKKYEQAS